jgi:hypothetical protein
MVLEKRRIVSLTAVIKKAPATYTNGNPGDNAPAEKGANGIGSAKDLL